MADTTISGSVVGDLTALNGKSLFILVEDPSNLFESQPSPRIDPNAGKAEVLLYGRLMTVAGHLEGNLRVFACLDAQCNEQIPGSPLLVPYSVEVLPGLTFPVPQIEVTSTFGDPTSVRAYAVQGPPNSQDFRSSIIEFGKPTELRSWVVNGDSAQLDIAFLMAPPGTYESSLNLSVSGAAHPQRWYNIYVPVTYRVIDNPAIEVAMGANQINLTRSIARDGGLLLPPTRLDLAIRPGHALAFVGVDYVSNPSGGTLEPYYGNWLEAGLSGVTGLPLSEETSLALTVTSRFCFSVGSQLNCPPVGEYRANLRLRMTRPDGSSRELLVPVTVVLAN